ncbi:PepSY domain-containing protein [Brucella intermedia]|uniref:PepSY domain-containing protein n=1 Tax=Brucella intermedia TaxID=94625 RepID=UPI00224A5DF6|nr:PepSY domain-containing protein [Brucella intermedia]
MNIWKKLTLPFIAIALFPTSALADGRHPDRSERQRIERALATAGFISWGEIDLDQERGREILEVEDARHKTAIGTIWNSTPEPL